MCHCYYFSFIFRTVHITNISKYGKPADKIDHCIQEHELQNCYIVVVTAPWSALFPGAETPAICTSSSEEPMDRLLRVTL